MPRRLRDALLVGGFVLVALAVRLLSVPEATRDGWRLLSPDCYGHLRRSWETARAFPLVPVRDPWLNHPDGGVWIWPPLFDLVVGGAARLLYGASVTIDQTVRPAAVLPPLLGALQVVPLWALARRALSRRRARVAVAAYALVPSAAIWSQFGHADQHVAEVLVLLVLLAACARSAEAALAPRGRFVAAALAGLALALLLLTWQGAVFAAGLVFAWAAFALGVAAPVLAATATAALAAATAFFVRGQPMPFTFVSFGWFQPALLAAGTLALALFAAVRTRERRTRAGLLALAAVLALAVVPVAGRIAGAVLRGGGYVFTHQAGTEGEEVVDGGLLFYSKDLLAVIAEARPLLGPPWRARLVQAVQELSPGLLLLPVAVVLWARPRARRGQRRLLALFGAALLLMTLSQVRNVYYLSVFCALALAEGLARLKPRALRGPEARPLVAAALVAACGLPQYSRITSYAGSPGSDLLETLARLRRLDPPPPGPWRPGEVEGVMAPWSAGHFVSAVAGRPAAADPNGYGWRRQCRFYSTPDDAEAEAILRQARCAWVLTTDLRPVLASYAAAAGRPGIPLAETLAVRLQEAHGPRPVPFLEEVLDSRTGYRGPDGRVLPRFRIFRVVRTATAAGGAPSPSPAARGAAGEAPSPREATAPAPPDARSRRP